MMHPIQQSLLEYSRDHNLAQMTFREIAKGIELPNESPQKIKHHLLQLQKKGFVKVDRVRGVMEKATMEPAWAKGMFKKAARIFSIPILGTASCGPATIFAKENFTGFLRVSGKLINQVSPTDLFAIKADGQSMNQVEIKGKKIEDGDYVIVKKDESVPSNNEIVLVIVDNSGVIKRFVDDRKNGQIILKSDSTFDYEPIYLHPDDEFFVNGKVIGIVKNQR
jgi:SOS-response transcriptional repressor LexA